MADEWLTLSPSKEEKVIISLSICFIAIVIFYTSINLASTVLIGTLIFSVGLYFFCLKRLLKNVSFTPVQAYIIEQSQWLLFLYGLFRLIAHVFEIKAEFSLLFYLGGIILFFSAIWSMRNHKKRRQNSLKTTVIAALLLLSILGVECSYYALQ